MAVRSSASARRTKPRARLNAYEALLAQDRNVKLDQVQIHIPAGPRLGDSVIQAVGLRKGYGDQVLIDGGLVNGSAHTVRWFGSVIRRVQNGYLYSYAFWMVIGLAILLGWFLAHAQG